MKQTNLYLPIIKDVNSQAVATSHILGLKAGLIHQVAAGIYSYLPMGTKVIDNIERIVNEEMENIGANKLVMPLLEPSELWEQTGRWQSYGDELFRVHDRNNGSFALAPTHEEIATSMMKNYLVSYKKYPVNIYQIGTKMRDEARPRFGLLRGREFIMFDGYSFHTSLECLENTYNDYYNAYKKIFNRIGLDFKVIKADNGQMGGTSSHEFMVLADIGEDTIVYVDDKEEGYNIEVAPVFYEEKEVVGDSDELKLIDTPKANTISKLCEDFNLDVKDTIKTRVYKLDDSFVMVLVRGDRSVNEIKVGKVFNKGELELATDEDLRELELPIGFIGPINVENIKIIADNELSSMINGYCGGNTFDTHYSGVNVKRDVKDVEFFDLRNIEEGDYVAKDFGPVKLCRGIEIGHIFALGNNYSKKMKLEYLNANQKLETPLMGCYGIGVSRLLSAILEQNNDENGIIFPKSITPFDVHLISLDYQKDQEQREFADNLYNSLKESGYSVLLDDRNERPGVKFVESDLIGLPVRIVVGKKFKENTVEVVFRDTLEKKDVNINDVLSFINR